MKDSVKEVIPTCEEPKPNESCQQSIETLARVIKQEPQQKIDPQNSTRGKLFDPKNLTQETLIDLVTKSVKEVLKNTTICPNNADDKIPVSNLLLHFKRTNYRFSNFFYLY